MIHTPLDLNLKMDILIGKNQEITHLPSIPFDDSVTNFLADLSKELLSSASNRTRPDVVSFAYWCRPANLTRLKNSYSTPTQQRLGLGLVFHICPSNVPINFAFSMAFGLLAGNSCVLKISSKPSSTTDILIESIQTILDRAEHVSMKNKLMLVRYGHDDDITRHWLSIADGRIVWGGDQTVQHIRHLPSRARSREIAFPDRYSLCVIHAESIMALEDESIRKLAHQLFNDIYLMNQAACSSPQLIAWVGEREKIKIAQTLLWPEVLTHAQRHFKPQPIDIMDKYVQLCQNVLHTPNVKSIDSSDNLLYRIQLATLNKEQEKYRGHFGTLYEIHLKALDELARIVTDRFQTLTYFGFSKTDLQSFVIDQKLRGIDRVVPIGKALDMNLTWDGYDLIHNLSRVISFE